MTNSGGAAVLVAEFDAQAVRLLFGVPGAKVHRVFDALVDSPTGDVFGHTSAVYIDVKGKAAETKEDAAFFIEWIDRLRTDIRRRNRVPGRNQIHVESQIAAAREVFNRLLDSKE